MLVKREMLLGLPRVLWGFILLAVVYKLSTIVKPWLAALIVGGMDVLLAAVILISASSKFKQIGAVPQRNVFCPIPPQSAR